MKAGLFMTTTTFDTKPLSAHPIEEIQELFKKKVRDYGVYSAPYRGFGPCDSLITMNGKLVTDLQGFSYSNDIGFGKSLELKLDRIILTEKGDDIKDGDLMLVVYMNEHGDIAYSAFDGLRPKTKESSQNVFDIVCVESEICSVNMIQTYMKPSPDIVMASHEKAQSILAGIEAILAKNSVRNRDVSICATLKNGEDNLALRCYIDYLCSIYEGVL